MAIYFNKKAQVRALLFDKTLIIVSLEYFIYSNVFSTKNAADFSKHIKINNHAIELEKRKQLFFSLIYSLKLVKLVTLKIYIKIN